jgi:crotonobetainyl-CoA:carnitine CoA-transferase CaiB-like acyl-CoA transferase
MTGPERGKEQPLKGLQVLDLTKLLPGPLCTMILGDYGAEIIKVEDIHAGDPTRFVGTAVQGSGSFFRQLNRNKKSIALNMKTEEGREVIRKLAERSDILVEGFRPGVMDRLKLGFETLRAINPSLIYVSISGYGQNGPYREKAGHDINYTALSGLLDLSAGKNDSPVMPAVQIADIAGGSLMAVSGILMALYKRQRNKLGSFVDISMTRSMLPWLAYAASFLDNPDQLPRRGCGHLTGAYACYNIYETSDGKQMSLGALEPAFWQKFCETVGKPQWVSMQFDDEGREELIDAVRNLFKKKTRIKWEEIFGQIDACCEPVLNLQEAIDHPISRSDNYWIRSSSADGENEILTGFPILFSGRPGELKLPPPLHGEHTVEILKSLGYQSEVIAEMREKGIISL